MNATTLIGNTLHVGRHFSLEFQRTLRIPDDGQSYPLPPGLGAFPVESVEDHAQRVPALWRDRGGYFIPMYQREALWIAFHAPYWRSYAVKIAVGGVNAVSGERWDARLHDDPQDYLVCPEQPWLDGIKSADGVIRQFVAMPLGAGFSVEQQVTGREETGGIQIVVFDSEPGRFPTHAPAHSDRMYSQVSEHTGAFAVADMKFSPEMGIGAGGRMHQKVYPDPYGIDTWDQSSATVVHVHIANSSAFREITGEEPPDSPVDAHSYSAHGYPWFSLYDEHLADVPVPDVLARIKSVTELDAERQGTPQQDDSTIEIPATQKKSI